MIASRDSGRRGSPGRGEDGGCVLRRRTKTPVRGRAFGTFGIESLQAAGLVGHGGGMRQHRLLGSAVLAQQAIQGAEPLLELGHRSQVGLEPVRGMTELVRDVDRLRLQPFQTPDERLQPRIGPSQVTGVVQRPGYLVLDAAPLAHQAVADRVREADRPLRAGEHGEPLPKLVHLARSRVDGRDLVDDVSRERQSPFDLLGGHLQRSQRVPVHPPFERHRRRPPARRGMAAEGIEQVALPGGRQQPLLVVLAVDGDEWLHHRRQPCSGHRLVVQAGDRPAAGARARGHR